MLAIGAAAPGPTDERAPELDDGDRVLVAASGRYVAGRVHRWVLGGGYRDLWERPVPLPVFRLAPVIGAFSPIGRFGGLQTAVLGLRDEDGYAYTFRGTDKDPSAILDPLLRDTLVEVIVQDQMAAQHPGGAPVAGALTRAAGVLAAHERLVVMPDDPQLDEYREEFAGMVGTLSVYPEATSGDREGFAGALEILGQEELYERLRADAEVAVDVRAFLRARLVDLLLGDFDRHRKQWRWARVPGKPGLQPIPEDRDQAFVRYDGFAQTIMRPYIPILQNYGPDYPSVKGLTLHGWEQDRWLLPALAWSDWQRVVADLQRRLTDDVIEHAIATMPAAYRALDGERLRRDIRGRRALLPEVARRFYLHLAREVDVRLSDAAESVSVVHDERCGMTIRVGAVRDGRRATTFERRFRPDETREVRVYLRGGGDDVEIEGEGGCILLRVVADGGQKRIEVASSARTRIYAASGDVEVEGGRRTVRVDMPYVAPPPDSGFVDVEDVPPRDWGSDTIPLPDFGYQPDAGVFLGAAAAHTRYGFRRDPWASKHELAFGWAFEANAPRVRYRGRYRPENARAVWELDLQYSGIEVLRFYGFGNETRDRGNDRFFRVRNERYDVAVGLVVPLDDERFEMRGSQFLRVSRTSRGARLIDRIDPYGNHDFLVPGLSAGFRFDGRRSGDVRRRHLQLPFHDNPAAGYPTAGVLFDVEGRFSPPLLDARRSYGSLRGSIAGFLSLGDGDRATLAVRLGGVETFGPTPFFDAATIGGGHFFAGDVSNRGFRSRRFTGDSAVYGNADLRLVLGRLKLIVPGDVGIHGFFDVGRVFYHDESSDEWHPSGGGGVFFSPLIRTNALSFSVSESPEETLFYLRMGFHY